MEKKSIRFIVNPISGTKGKQNVVSLIPECFPSESFDVEVCYTERAGHAAELAKDAAERHMDIAVAVGGDGTVNEVARSLTQSQTALGIIPCGSGNGLARHLGIPMQAHKALEVLAKANIETLDYGLINEHPFFCTCGVGFDAFVSKKFAESGKRGLLSYVENTLKEGMNYKPETYEVTIGNEKTSYQAFLIACGNASQYGNNVFITPGASMSDGLMDVTILEPFSILEAPQIVTQLFNKNIGNNRRVKTFTCEHLSIRREGPGVVHFDGDPVECGELLDIRLVKQGIRVVVNPVEKIVAPTIFAQAFEAVYSDVVSETKLWQESVNRASNKILAINNNLLNKLRNHK